MVETVVHVHVYSLGVGQAAFGIVVNMDRERGTRDVLVRLVRLLRVIEAVTTRGRAREYERAARVMIWCTGPLGGICAVPRTRWW